MSDLISREELMKLWDEYQPYIAVKAIEFGNALKEIPSAEPVRHGEWIPHEDEDGEHYGDKCSECGEWYVMPYGKTNFCPNCGARMDKDE